MFLQVKDRLVNVAIIKEIELVDLSKGWLHLHYTGNRPSELVEGHQAFEIVWRLCPEALEGKALKSVRYTWALHNLVAHPLMQILSWLGWRKTGLALHDGTIPMATNTRA